MQVKFGTACRSFPRGKWNHWRMSPISISLPPPPFSLFYVLVSTAPPSIITLQQTNGWNSCRYRSNLYPQNRSEIAVLLQKFFMKRAQTGILLSSLDKDFCKNLHVYFHRLYLYWVLSVYSVYARNRRKHLLISRVSGSFATSDHQAPKFLMGRCKQGFEQLEVVARVGVEWRIGLDGGGSGREI